jgi:hypothetical protein
MLSPADFRTIALGMEDAVESSHMGHPDFRANGKIFASLSQDSRRGMVKLTPEQQRQFVRAHPKGFEPSTGAWGRNGSTTVKLEEVDEETVGEAMTLAWQNTASKRSGLK